MPHDFPDDFPDDCPASAAGARPTLGLIGAGAFGAFALPHLTRHFDAVVSDPRPDIDTVAGRLGVPAVALEAAARCDVVVLAVPWRALEGVGAAIAPHLRPGTLVVETCSIKVRPLETLRDVLPGHVRLVGTHPLFGPQSGRTGITGLNIAVCAAPGRPPEDRDAARRSDGDDADRVARFLGLRLGLTVLRVSAEEHDRQMAYVQGLTHFLARAIAAMDLPDLTLTTSTWGHLMRMAETVRHDSDDLYRTIAEDNPFAAGVRERFLAAARDTLAGPPAGTPVRSRTPVPAAGREPSGSSRSG